MSRLKAVDLHCHTYLSDGDLGPAELIRRLEAAGLSGLAITDHADASNLERAVEAAVLASEAERRTGRLLCAPGVEITHVRPGLVGELIEKARKCGARFVVVHGETPVEPVEPGTNRAAIEAGCDLLAHPGLIEGGLVEEAARRGVLLEISGRIGHCLANGHVAALARERGARVAFGGDLHDPENVKSPEEIVAVLRGAGLTRQEAEHALQTGRDALVQALSSS